MNDLGPCRSAMELHDSHISEWRDNGDCLECVCDPAIVHKSEGTPGVDPGSCWIQGAILTFEESEVLGAPPPLPCPLADGCVLLGDRRFDNVIPAPFEFSGPVTVQLRFADGASVTVMAKQLRVILVGTATYLEDFT